jgi:hypothetical protein
LGAILSLFPFTAGEDQRGFAHLKLRLLGLKLLRLLGLKLEEETTHL